MKFFYNIIQLFVCLCDMIKKLNAPFTTILITCQSLLIVSHLAESFDVPLGCLSEVCSGRVIREYTII